jgi:ABC-type nitrate/sulfonate/bicarbonate transport system permease component
VLSVVGAVVGEWVGSDEGLGFLIIQSNAKLATTTVFGAVVVLTLMGIVLFLIVTLIEWLALPWNRRPTKG